MGEALDYARELRPHRRLVWLVVLVSSLIAGALAVGLFSRHTVMTAPTVTLSPVMVRAVDADTGTPLPLVVTLTPSGWPGAATAPVTGPATSFSWVVGGTTGGTVTSPGHQPQTLTIGPGTPATVTLRLKRTAAASDK